MSPLSKRKTYFIESYGCQMNLYDADLMASILEGADYQPATDLSEADVILVNTCSVREHAEQRAIGRIRELAGLKRIRPAIRLVVCGCMAQRLGREILRLIPGLDAVVGTDSYGKLPELLERSKRMRLVQKSLCPQQLYSRVMPRYQGGVSAFVAVMRGCDNRCSYCVVPQLRGPARSRALKDIIREVATLVDLGCREITFLGQNVNAYRDGALGFVDLLRKSSEMPGLWRIRFVTSHPRDMNEEILMVMAQSDKVCEHLHLPLQAGSDRILGAMRRGYTAERYRRLISRARELIPGVSITTDLMAGFPGESEADFGETIRMCEELEFDDAFTFAYSPRPGTEAVDMPHQVSAQVRHERLQRLIAVQRDMTHRVNQRLVSHTVEVLVERTSKRNAEEFMGRTRSHKVVIFPGHPELLGTLVRVHVQRTRGGTTWGDLVSQADGRKVRTTTSEPRRSSVKS